ncbi:hypothetical protein ICN48_10790 [Polynucleobacter sp. JS-Safj-400b-B2]|uniref:hypothetical protein n=1 Tax=Polynucleobacter sp. JS-Safj-400b-B2 TaxID=2576921 RepID=UPI001C0AB81D|nr:hypothetical protein [Polynucleobacter sp. JS-Safj-400b-B2]MBU3626717.1 hypothetical protein [Polynucleobacter sp. JS-Safj-400b-B2]
MEMTSQYDNLAVIHHDCELLWSQFSKVLSTPFHPKYGAEPSILAACIRISSSEQNLEYLGGYLLQKINSDNQTRQSLPPLVAEVLQSAHELKVIRMQLASYVLKSCKNYRLPLVI